VAGNQEDNHNLADSQEVDSLADIQVDNLLAGILEDKQRLGEEHSLVDKRIQDEVWAARLDWEAVHWAHDPAQLVFVSAQLPPAMTKSGHR
jgi:hypothetical protein